MNYTLPSYMDDKNIIWFVNADWEFGRAQYEKMIEDYWAEETLDEVINYSCDEMSVDNCANLISKVTRNGNTENMITGDFSNAGQICTRNRKDDI